MAQHLTSELWLCGLELAAPSGNAVALMEWQRTLAALACSCTLFRDLLRSPAADALFSEAAVARYYNWRAWRAVDKTACTMLLRGLCAGRAHRIKELYLDCSAVSPELLATSLPRLTGLQRLHTTHLGSAGAEGLEMAFRAGLPSLVHLSGSGRCQLPAVLPSGLTSVDVPVQLVQTEPDWEAWWHLASLFSIDALQTLDVCISGPDPLARDSWLGATAACMLYDRLQLASLPTHSSSPATASLEVLNIVQHVRTEDWLCKRSIDPKDPLLFLAQVAQNLVSFVRHKLEDPGFDSLSHVRFDLRLPGDCCTTVGGHSADVYLGEDTNCEVQFDEQQPAPEVWRAVSVVEFRRADGRKNVEAEVHLFTRVDKGL